jgi:tetratricopeptide (TPR) repeat protein
VSLAFVLRAADEWTARQQAARVALQHQDYAGAIRLFGECVSLAANDDQRVTALGLYGIALNRAERNQEAKAALEQALAVREKAGGDDERVVISGVLASVDRSLGDYQGAERVLRTAIGDSSARGGTRSTLMVNLTDLLREESRGNEARSVLDEASRLTGLSPEEHTSVLVETAELARDLHLWSESVAAWNKIGEIAENAHSPKLEEEYTGGLGETWFVSGNLTRAEPLLKRSLQLLREDATTSPLQVATALGLMAHLYINEGKLALADEVLEEAIAKDEGTLGAAHPQLAPLLELRADILSRRGELQSARNDAERARSIMATHFGPDSTEVAGALTELGDVEARAKRPEAAVAQYAIALDLLRAAGADGFRFEPALVARYAAALKSAHRPEDARRLLRSFSVETGDAGKGPATTALAKSAGFREK